jgi:flagellar biogenesis protein FliO
MSGAADLVMLARVTGSLVVVVLVALLVARLARRAGARGGTGGVRVLDRVGLSRETAAVVLEVGDRTLLLGVGPTQVTVLADLTDPGAGPVRPAAALPSVLGEVLDAEPAPADSAAVAKIPAPRSTVRTRDGATTAVVTTAPLSRRALRQARGRGRLAVPPTRRGTGSALDPRTWQQGLEALRDLTARRG